MADQLAGGMAALLCGLACATAPAAPEKSQATAADYAPLAVGASWTYAVEYPGQKGEMTVALVGEKDGYLLDNKNGALRHTSDGLRDRDRYLLRHPIVPGTKWKSVVGPSTVEQLEIKSVGEPCESLAGRFSDCVVVGGSVRGDQQVELQIEWTWARDVGLVKLSTVAEIQGKGRVPQVTQSLKSYSREGDAKEKPAEADDGPGGWTRG